MFSLFFFLRSIMLIGNIATELLTVQNTLTQIRKIFNQGRGLHYEINISNQKVTDCWPTMKKILHDAGQKINLHAFILI